MYRVCKQKYLEQNTTVQTEEVLERSKSAITPCYSKLGVMACYLDQYSTITLLVHGGLNGSGEWDKYLDDLADLTERLLDEFSDVWIIRIDDDCLDDVFYAYFGIRI